MALKASITRNKHGNYEVWVNEEIPGYVPRPRAGDVTLTLWGARRKARKLLAKVELQDEFAKFVEEIK